MSALAGLERLSLFSHFQAPQLEQLARCASRRDCGEGTTLFEREDRGKEIYLVESGSLRAWAPTPMGDFEFRTLGPGELFGEVSFIDRAGRMSHVDAAAESVLLVFDNASLRALADLDADFARSLGWTLWKSLSAKLRHANAHLSSFFSPGVTSGSHGGQAQGSTLEESAGRNIGARRDLFREQRLPSMEINFLAALSRQESFLPGETIFREGDAGDKLYVVAEGEVMISKSIPGAGEEALSFLERGEFFGEMSLIDKEPRSADARSHPEHGAVVLSLGTEVIEQLLGVGRPSSRVLLDLFCRLTAARLRKVNEKLLGWHLLSAGGGAGAVQRSA